MKKIIFVGAILIMGLAHSQVGIGTRAPAGMDDPDSLVIKNNPKGILHLQGQHYYYNDSVNRNLGLVVPRVEDITIDTVRTPNKDYAVKGTMVFDSIQGCLRVKTADGKNGWDTDYADCLVSVSVDDITDIIDIYEGMPIQVKKVSAGNNFSLIIDGTDGTLYSTGANTSGQTGLGTTSGTPTATFKMVLARNIKDMSAGYNHALAVDEDGVVWAWGEGDYLRTGLGGTSDFTFPKKIQQGAIPVKAKAVRVEAGYYNSLVLCDDGKVYAFGGFANRMLGNAAYTANQGAPVLVPITTGTNPDTGKPYGIKDIAITRYSAAAIDSAGKVYVWGNPQYCRLGTGVAYTNTTLVSPTQLTTLTVPIKQVALGNRYGIAIGEDNKLYGWGDIYGWGVYVSGTGATRYSTSPQEITSYLPQVEKSGINGVSKNDLFVPDEDAILYVAADRFNTNPRGTIVITSKTVYGAGGTSTSDGSTNIVGLGTVMRSTTTTPKYSPNNMANYPFTGFYPIYKGTMDSNLKFVQASIGVGHSLIAASPTVNSLGKTVYGYGYGAGACGTNQLGAVNVSYTTLYINTLLKK